VHQIAQWNMHNKLHMFRTNQSAGNLRFAGGAWSWSLALAIGVAGHRLEFDSLTVDDLYFWRLGLLNESESGKAFISFWFLWLERFSDLFLIWFHVFLVNAAISARALFSREVESFSACVIVSKVDLSRFENIAFRFSWGSSRLKTLRQSQRWQLLDSFRWAPCSRQLCYL